MWEHLVVLTPEGGFGNALLEASIQVDLDKYGNEGWELVSVASSPYGGLYLFFKRPAE